MRFKVFVAFFIVVIISITPLLGQSVTYALDDEIDGTTLQVPSEGLQITDDGHGYGYSAGYEWVVTVSNSEHPCQSPYTLAITFLRFDLEPCDTLFIYDGPNVSYPLLLEANNDHNYPSGYFKMVYATMNNNSTTHALTIRFKTSSNSWGEGGFLCTVGCEKPCELTIPHIDTVFERIRNGEAYASDIMKMEDGRRVINVCGGDGVRVHGYGEYTNKTGHYNPSDETSTFRWTLDDKDHVQSAVGMKNVTYPKFDTLGCHSLVLSMSDENGCEASMFDQIQIRTSINPIKTISNIGTICNNTELAVRVSYGEGDAVMIDSIAIDNMFSQSNNAKTFIPDGPYCATRCYSAPVTFNEFPQGQTVMSGDDICSICVNYEHSYMGDYDLIIECPNGRSATLKYFDASEVDLPDGASGGGGTYTGYPYGGDDDGKGDGDEYCDSIYNMYGVGLDYCFSRNGNYTLVDGTPADNPEDGEHYLGNSSYIDAVEYTFPPMPPAFRRAYFGSDDDEESLESFTSSFSTKHPSDHARKMDYYKPADNFDKLIGCPLNGTWKIKICDQWEADNGWVFGWSMDLCTMSLGEDCEYSVGIDSIIWDVTTEVGTSSVVNVRKDPTDPMLFYMSAFDTAGRFYAKMSVFDEFGCRWDSNGYFTVLWSPTTMLGDDRFFCEDKTVLLDASDRHSAGSRDYQYSYVWNTGETTPSITPKVDTTTTFHVRVTSSATNGDDVSCSVEDSVKIIIGIRPEAMFGPDSLGVLCSPYTMGFENLSKDAVAYAWDFGDGASSTTASPTHTYVVGDYTVKLYAISSDGCRDTLIRENYIHVEPRHEGVQTAMICNGEEFTWVDGITYYEPTSEPYVIITSAMGCDSLLHLHLGVDNETKAQIHVSPEVASLDDTRVCVDDYGVNSYSRTWWLPDGSMPHGISACFDYPIVEDSVRVILEVRSKYGCTDTTSVVIRFDRSQIWMPNVFTPDEPNNSRLSIPNTAIDQVDAVIYNRSGQLVYRFKNKNDSWDGKCNGKDCSQGIYVYLIRYTTYENPERWQQKKGTVMLLR